MTPFQFLLAASLIGILVFLYRTFAGKRMLKILLGAILAAGLTFTLFPELSQTLAHFLGIGRGADLVIYSTLVGLIAACLLLYLRTVRLEEMIIQLTREQAIKDALTREGTEGRQPDPGHQK